MASAAPILVLMGVSGSGKTTIGELLSKKTKWTFYEGDDFHPEKNVAKMKSGTPLTDEDRVPWLLAIREIIEKHLENNTSAIIACSALKASYREVLQRDDKRIHFVFLNGKKALIQSRLDHRKDHYMPADLLQSQFDSLEEPEDALLVDIQPAPEEIVNQILATHK